MIIVMIPLLIPRSLRTNVLFQQTLPELTRHFQVREIDNSPTTPGDLIFPSLGIACLLCPAIDDVINRAGSIIQRRRRCVILTTPEDLWQVQLRYITLETVMLM